MNLKWSINGNESNSESSDDFFELGGTSLDALDMIENIENEIENLCSTASSGRKLECQMWRQTNKSGKNDKVLKRINDFDWLREQFELSLEENV